MYYFACLDGLNVNVDFEELTDWKSDHFSFNFKTFYLPELLSISIYLIDSNNNQIMFKDNGKKKISLLKFQIDIYQ